jgi:hypothetical protein
MFRGSRDALWASLSRLSRQTYRKTPNASALADALTNLQGVALDALPEPTCLRVAEGNGNIIIDLGTADGRAIVVNADGWRVADQSPVLFRRTALTAALPAPQRGGKPTLLRELLNVTDESRPVLLGWIVAAFLLKIAHAILMLGGEAGSGKSTLARPFQVLRQSCATELAMTFPQKAIAAWLGHSEKVSSEHYLHVPDELYDRAAGRRPGSAKGGAAKGAAKSAAVGPRTESQGAETASVCHDVTAQENAEKQGVFCDSHAENAIGPGGIRTPDQAIMSRLL